MAKKTDNPAIEKMIANVMKHREIKREQAIEYMLGVATGRLLALKRYGDTLPEGKSSKGVMAPGKRKRAERSKPVVKAPAVEAAQ